MDLYENEAVVDGGVEAGAADPGDASGVADPGSENDTAAAEQPAAADTQAAPAWAPTQDDWHTLTSTVQQLSQAITPPAPAAPAPPQLADYMQTDPATGEAAFTPEGLEKYIGDQIARGVNERLSPVEPVLNQTILDRGEQLITQRLEQLKGEVGDFDAGLARTIAEGLAVLPGADPNAALKQAAERAREFAKTIGDKAVEEYKQTLGNIGGAQREPGAAGAAVDRVQPRPGPDGYGDVARAFLERHGISA